MLPSTHVFLSNPTVPDLLSGLNSAISQVQNNPVCHPRILTDQDKQILDWYHDFKKQSVFHNNLETFLKSIYFWLH